MYNVHNAFYAPSGTIIEWTANQSQNVALLIDSGICEWCYINGDRKLITL